MKIHVIEHESGRILKVIDYEQLLKICANDKRMAEDFLRMIRKHPDNVNLYNETWRIVEE